MKLAELKRALRENPNKRLNIIFPDGDPIEPEFHVTEVGHVVKNFIDCGGTIRRSEKCVLQTWVSGSDKEHRLTTEKLSGILAKSAEIVPDDELPVEIEYEGCNVVQYPVEAIATDEGEIRLTLGKNHTDCLAKEACGVETGCSQGAGCCS
ncbi:MAG TPA: DUF6428 family protein [Opitutaceae bacterium]